MPPVEKWTAPRPPVDVPTWGVATCAFLSIIWAMSTKMSFLLHGTPAHGRWDSSLGGLPRLLAFTAAAAGFPAFAALFAIFGALPWGFYSLVTIGLGAGPGTGAGLLLLL